MKTISILSLLLFFTQCKSQDTKQIEIFNEQVLLNKNLTLEKYKVQIYYYNHTEKNLDKFRNYFKIIQKSISEINSKIANSQNLLILNYDEIPNNYKKSLYIKLKENYKIYFLFENRDDELIYITHYILNDKKQIISFFNQLSKKRLEIKPWYLDEKMD